MLAPATQVHNLCTGSRHIGHRLLSLVVGGGPLLVELVRGEVAEGLVGTAGFVEAGPGGEGGLQPAEVSGPFLDVVELVVVGTEGAFDAAVALGVVGPVEVVGELKLRDGFAELTEKLAATV